MLRELAMPAKSLPGANTVSVFFPARIRVGVAQCWEMPAAEEKSDATKAADVANDCAKQHPFPALGARWVDAHYRKVRPMLVFH